MGEGSQGGNDLIIFRSQLKLARIYFCNLERSCSEIADCIIPGLEAERQGCVCWGKGQRGRKARVEGTKGPEENQFTVLAVLSQDDSHTLEMTMADW